MSKKDVIIANQERGMTQNGMTPLVVDLGEELPDLTQFDEAPIDLMADYWTPEKFGETKRVIFLEIKPRMILDQVSQDQIELESAYFMEKDGAEWRQISNGSKRLIAALINRKIQPGTALSIKYLGKVKNKTNNFKSDNWSVKILILEQ